MANQNPNGSATGTLANGSLNTTYTLYDSTLLQGFSDPDGDTLKISGLWADSGELTDLGNGSWSFVPETDYSGAVVFDYVVFDSKGGEVQGMLSFNIASPQIAPTGNVTISGTAQQNQTLFAANNLADANGIGAISYQWLINNSVVSNSDSYALTQNDVGKNISLRASYTDGLGKSESVTSSAVTVSNVNDLPTGNVTISGTAAQGQTLTASNNLQDVDGLGTIGYQWLRDGATISNAISSSYTLTASDVSKAITVKASYTDGFQTFESVTSDVTALIVASQTVPTGNVTIDGTASQNQTISANTNSIADVNGLGTFSYQWLSNGNAITGQTSQSYSLTQADVGKNISVKVSYTDGLQKLESITSPSVAVSNVNDLPTGSVTISGDLFQGQTLSASNDIADLDGLGSISYQWLQNGAAVSNATKSSYTLVATDVGKTINVKASYIDGFNELESVTSNATQTVSPPKNDAPTGSVTISGYAQQKQTLTVNNTLADANNIVGAISYQWLKNDTAINGQTAQSYTLSQSDVGKSIGVKASYTDGLGKLESVASSNVTVANVNDLPTGSVTISGTPTQGQILTASNTLQDADGLGAIGYQWFSNGNVISSATTSTYTLAASDVGKIFTVKASYTDLQNTSESVISSPLTISALILTLNSKNPNSRGTADADNVEGSTIADSIFGQLGNDILKGNSGDDTIDGGNDDDQLFGGADDDSLIGGDGNDLLNGGDDNDVLDGGNGDDTLDGGSGVDKMTGGNGDDVYFVENINDTVIESTSPLGGKDTVNSSITLAQLEAIEVINLLGENDINATGDNNVNTLRGSITNGAKIYVKEI